MKAGDHPMSLIIVPFTLGPLENNVYLVANPETDEAAVIDPSFDSEVILDEVKQRKWKLKAIWITHAHFDHMAGAQAIASAFNPPLPVGLHSDDLQLWQAGGGSKEFDISIDAGPTPEMLFHHAQRLNLGTAAFEVRHTPGHTPGHVIFYCPEVSAAFVGDLIFYHSIGRADLPYSDPDLLLESIRTQVLTLPPNTRLFNGHGSATTVQEEMQNNPFLS
jgi:hydroxyacylglutathione hydrolase